jgi:methylenetetrahydrofolate reductase (NADPH)
MQYLKDKIDVGCSWIFTQMFFDVDLFIRWVKAVRAAGITVPIVPGIMPIQTWNGFQKATRMANTVVPQHMRDALEPIQNNDEEVRRVGTKLVAEMCRKILNSGLDICGIHFYTMNLEKGTRMLLEELNLVPRVEIIKPLPWRQASFISFTLEIN